MILHISMPFLYALVIQQFHHIADLSKYANIGDCRTFWNYSCLASFVNVCIVATETLYPICLTCFTILL